MNKFFAIFFALLIITQPAVAKKRKYAVSDNEYRTVSLSNGKSIACYTVKEGAAAVPGNIRKKKKKDYFFPSSKADKRKIKKAKKALSGAKGPQKKKAKRKLTKLKSLIKEKKQACALGIDTPEQDPENVFEPLSGIPTQANIRLLLERAAFGNGRGEAYVYEAAQNGGINAAVTALMGVHAEPNGLAAEVDDWLDGRLENSDDRRMEFYGMRNAWITLLAHTNNTFREKFALFLWSIWGASESSFGYNERDYLWEYITSVREHAYKGSLIEMTRELSVSPSMLRWLNNSTNVKGFIQEEFASSFLHAFMLGTENYQRGLFSDTDVHLVARAFSGWQLVALENSQGEDVLRPFFISSAHVSGPKGLFAGTPYSCTVDTEEDVYSCLFNKHNGVAEYYSKALLRFYLTEEPSVDLIKAFAAVIKENNFQLDAALAVLFKSAIFYSDQYKNTAIKNPIEVGIEWVRTMNIPVDVGNSYRGLRAQFDRMNMSLTSNRFPAWFAKKKHLSQNYFLSLSNFYAAAFRQSDLFEELGWTAQAVLPRGEIYSRDIILHVARALDVSLNEDQISQLKYYMDYRVNYENEHERALYDNLLPSHHTRKGLGLYMLLGMTPDFILK